jgi:hypothetical protein
MIESVDYRWSGQVLEPVDSLAFIGRNPTGDPRVYIVTGDSGNGLTHGTIGGMIVPELTYKTTIGNLGYEKMTFPNPVFHGDTIRAESTILKKRESKSRTDAGIVWFEHRGYNQRDELIHLCHRTGMMMKKPVGDESAAG